MRIDLVLKYLCLARSRSLVKSLCERNAIWLNGRPAKPSSDLHVKDRVTIETRSGTLTVSVVNVPQKQLSKAVAPTYYEVVDHEQTNMGEDAFEE
ncbi:MAG: S4 domain-containing protein [Candidatus Krumholzibacteria bacterium]|nr:S4 domain-containing protein [Candidatus Krumholzibacteria bacterium]